MQFNMSLFKTMYGKAEDFILRNTSFNKLAASYHNKKENSSASYKRQGADTRTKEIKDWQRALMEATDPENPRRAQMHAVYESLLRDEDLQTAIDNRVLPLQLASFCISDIKGNDKPELKMLLERPWFQELKRYFVMNVIQGVVLVDLTAKMDRETMEIKEVDEIPLANYIAQKGIIIYEPYDNEGSSYREGALKDYYVQFGKDWALGMLNELAIALFAKKLGFGSWISYIDTYGIPFLFVITERMDTTRRDELFDMLQDMRSGRFGVLQGQEHIDMGKEASGTTTNAFDPFMERCHRIITSRVLGQTGTTTNEAWEGTAEVHEKVEAMRHKADKVLFQYYFNYEIIPRLVKISPVYAQFAGCHLEWDDHETLSLKDYIDAIQKLSYTFDFDPEKVAEMTGLPITAAKQITNQGTIGTGNSPTDPKPEPAQKKKSVSPAKAVGMAGMVNALYYVEGEMPTADIRFALSDKIRDRVLNRLRSKGFDVEKDIDPDLFTHTCDHLNAAIDKGFGEVEYGTPDYDFLYQLRHNNAVFAAFKTHRQQHELHARLFDEGGNAKPFEQFRKDTRDILQNYNVNWLRTEHDTCIRRARFAADFRGYQANADIYPNLEWLPSVSPHPREAHKVFYGLILPVEDIFWQTNYPGNLWNCKCRVSSTNKAAGTWNKKGLVQPDPGLDGNPAFTGSIFSDTHPYIKGASKETRKAVDEHLHKEYTRIPTENGELWVHDRHGKNEKTENIKVGKFLAEKHGYRIDLIENPDNVKSADSFNHTLGRFQEYKVNNKASINAIDRAIRDGRKQANDLVLWIESDISWEDLSNAISSRVNRCEGVTHITIIRDKKDRRYSREEILSKGFKIQQADLK